MNRIRTFAIGAATALIMLVAVVSPATPAYATCGDTTAEWVDPTSGSAWSGTLDGSTGFTAVLAPEVLGVRAAATVVSGLAGTGAGTWIHDYNTRWTATAAGVWEYRFEVSASSCSGGIVDAAAGAATDSLNTVHYVLMDRML